MSVLDGAGVARLGRVNRKSHAYEEPAFDVYELVS